MTHRRRQGLYWSIIIKIRRRAGAAVCPESLLQARRRYFEGLCLRLFACTGGRGWNTDYAGAPSIAHARQLVKIQQLEEKAMFVDWFNKNRIEYYMVISRSGFTSAAQEYGASKGMLLFDPQDLRKNFSDKIS